MILEEILNRYYVNYISWDKNHEIELKSRITLNNFINFIKKGNDVVSYSHHKVIKKDTNKDLFEKIKTQHFTRVHSLATHGRDYRFNLYVDYNLNSIQIKELEQKNVTTPTIIFEPTNLYLLRIDFNILVNDKDIKEKFEIFLQENIPNYLFKIESIKTFHCFFIMDASGVQYKSEHNIEMMFKTFINSFKFDKYIQPILRDQRKPFLNDINTIDYFPIIFDKNFNINLEREITILKLQELIDFNIKYNKKQKQIKEKQKEKERLIKEKERALVREQREKERALKQEQREKERALKQEQREKERALKQEQVLEVIKKDFYILTKTNKRIKVEVPVLDWVAYLKQNVKHIFFLPKENDINNTLIPYCKQGLYAKPINNNLYHIIITFLQKNKVPVEVLNFISEKIDKYFNPKIININTFHTIGDPECSLILEKTNLKCFSNVVYEVSANAIKKYNSKNQIYPMEYEIKHKFEYTENDCEWLTETINSLSMQEITPGEFIFNKSRYEYVYHTIGKFLNTSKDIKSKQYKPALIVIDENMGSNGVVGKSFIVENLICAFTPEKREFSGRKVNKDDRWLLSECNKYTRNYVVEDLIDGNISSFYNYISGNATVERKGATTVLYNHSELPQIIMTMNCLPADWEESSNQNRIQFLMVNNWARYNRQKIADLYSKINKNELYSQLMRIEQFYLKNKDKNNFGWRPERTSVFTGKLNGLDEAFGDWLDQFIPGMKKGKGINLMDIVNSYKQYFNKEVQRPEILKRIKAYIKINLREWKMIETKRYCDNNLYLPFLTLIKK